MLAKLRGIVSTELVRRRGDHGVGTVTRIGMKIPTEDASILQSTVLNTLKGGSAATCDIDPDKPLGDQLLNVLKAASVAGVQSLASGAAGKYKKSRTEHAPSSVEVTPEGTVVISKQDSAKYLKEIARAARERGETVSFKAQDTVDAEGRRIVEVTLADGTKTRIAIDDAVVSRPATETPKQLNTSEEPEAPHRVAGTEAAHHLGRAEAKGGQEPKQLTTSEEPKLLTGVKEPKPLTTSEEPKLLGPKPEPVEPKTLIERSKELYQHFDQDGMTEKLREYSASLGKGGNEDASLAFTNVPDDALQAIMTGDGNLKAAAAFGAEGANAQQMWFGAKKPFYPDGLTLVIPRDKLAALGGIDGFGLAGQKDVITLAHGLHPTGISIKDMAIVYSVAFGLVVPIYKPPGWTHGLGAEIPPELMPAQPQPPGFKYATPGTRMAFTEVPVAELQPTQATVVRGKIEREARRSRQGARETRCGARDRRQRRQALRLRWSSPSRRSNRVVARPSARACTHRNKPSASASI